MTPRIGLGMTALAITLFWALLIGFGFPFPHPDDPAVIGAGLHMAGGGPLVNPLLGPRPDYDYTGYTPFYSYLLAGALKLLGVSAASLVLFHALLCWGISWNLVRIFQILEKEACGWLLLAGVVVYLGSTGLRPDAAALFFLFLAIRLGLARHARWPALSPFFALVGIAILPALLVIGVPWIVWLLASERALRPTVAGGSLVFLAFCLMLHGRLSDYLAAFSHHHRNEDWFRHHWYRPENLAKFAVLPLCGCLCVGRKMLRQRAALSDLLCLSAVLSGYYASLNSVSGQRILGLTALACVLFYLPLAWPSLARTPWPTGLLAALLFASMSRPLLQGLTAAKPSAARRAQLLGQVEALHPSRIGIDWWSLRYVFDYRLRPGMEFHQFPRNSQDSAPGPHLLIPLAGNGCWVLSAEAVNYFHIDDRGLPVPRLQAIAGKTLKQWVANAGDMTVYAPGSGE